MIPWRASSSECTTAVNRRVVSDVGQCAASKRATCLAGNRAGSKMKAQDEGPRRGPEARTQDEELPPEAGPAPAAAEAPVGGNCCNPKIPPAGDSHQGLVLRRVGLGLIHQFLSDPDGVLV